MGHIRRIPAHSARLVLGAAIMLASSLAARTAEPSVAGRPLNQWIADLEAKDTLIREEALEILPEFGSEAKPAIPRIAALYQSGSPAVRFRAAIALWRIDGRTEPAMAVLTEALKSDGRSKRLQAVELLMQLGRPAAELAPPVLELMRGEPDYSIQSQVQMMLAQFGAEAVPAVRDVLGRAKADERLQILTLIQNLGPEFRGVMPAVVALRKEPDPRTRFAALRTIYVLDQQNKEVLTELVQAGKSTDAGIRREAFQAALMLSPRPKELAPFFRIFLKDDDLTTRCQAAAALYQVDPTTLKEGLPVVRKVVQDGSPNTWSMAVSALGWFGPAAKEALPDLMNMLKRPEARGYGYMIVQACRSIGPDAVPVLLELFQDPQAYYRSQAQQTLSDIGPDAIPKLRPALQHANPAVRQMAVEVLKQFGPGARLAVADLAKCLKDEDANVRSRALSALEGLGPDAKEAIPALVEFLRDAKQNESLRWQAMDALGKIGREAKSAVADIEPVLKNSNTLVRCRAAAAIMQIDPKRRGEFMPMFLTPLREKSPTPGLTGAYLVQMLAEHQAPRAEVMAGLMEFVKNRAPDSQLQVAQGITAHYPNEPGATPVLRELWKSKEPLAKLEAAIGLSRAKEMASEVVPFLVEKARTAPGPLRIRLLTALASYETQAKIAIPGLLDQFRGGTDAGLRFHTAEAILLIDPSQQGVREWIRGQFSTNASAIRRGRAACVLCKIDPTFDQLRPTLERWARQGNVTNAAAGLEILGLLGEHGKPAVPVLRTAMNDPLPLKRVRAAKSLWQIEKQADKVLPVLTAALAEIDPPRATYFNPGFVPAASRMAAQQAAQALAEIGPAAKTAIPALRQAQLAPDATLRQLATEALRKIEGSR